MNQYQSCNYDLFYEVEHLHYNFMKFWLNGMLWDHQNVQIHILHTEFDEILGEIFNFIREITIAALILIQ